MTAYVEETGQGVQTSMVEAFEGAKGSLGSPAVKDENHGPARVQNDSAARL